MIYSLLELQNIIKKLFENPVEIKKPENLYKPAQYIMEDGGKRLRPLFVLAACNMFSDSVDDALSTASAYEIFHNFTLLHDDVMDNSPVRRGRPTVHKKWDANTAILSGDAMMILAWQNILKTPDQYLKQNIELFNTTALEVCEGQQLDMDFEKNNLVSEQQYFEMIRLKTSVLPAACLKSGAIIGGASVRNADLLYEFGLNIGLAFQLQDDFLDVYGNTESFGKRIGGDILADKKTFLMIKAIETADFRQKEAIFKLQGKSLDENYKIGEMTKIYNFLNIKDKTLEKIQDFFQKSIQILNSVDAPDNRKLILRTIAESLMNRQK